MVLLETNSYFLAQEKYKQMSLCKQDVCLYCLYCFLAKVARKAP